MKTRTDRKPISLSGSIYPVALCLVVGIALLFCGRVALINVRAASVLLRPTRKPVPFPDSLPELAALTPVSFVTTDGLTIRGWYLPPRNRALVILTHGFGENRTQMLPPARFLARHGYGILLFDWRSHGESDGDISTWGYREQDDLRAALDFLTAHPEVDQRRVGAVGFSIGGSAVAQVAATDQRISAVVLEGTYTSLRDVIRDDFGRWGPLSQYPVLWTYRNAGIDVDAVDNVKAVSALPPRPILIINGDTNDVPPGVAAELNRAAREPKDYWLVPGSGHGEYAGVAPQEYERRIIAFFNHALLGQSPSNHL